MEKRVKEVKEVKEVVGGYILELDSSSTIVDITKNWVYYSLNKILRLNDEVVANGRIFVPKGTRGKVTKILQPYSRSYTSDIICVDFHDGKGLCSMKFKDLDLEW